MPAITPALEHRLSMAMAVNAGATAEDLQLAFGVDPAVAQIMLRLTHDLRRLKDIHSIEAKIEAKRVMLPDYREWCELRLAAGAAAEGNELLSSGADDVLPTMMVWAIDTGNWPVALELAEHVVRFNVALPDRYKRSAPALIVEEISLYALKVQSRGDVFPLWVLERVAVLTAPPIEKPSGLSSVRRIFTIASVPRAGSSRCRRCSPPPQPNKPRSTRQRNRPARRRPHSSPPGARGQIARDGRAFGLWAVDRPDLHPR